LARHQCQQVPRVRQCNNLAERQRGVPDRQSAKRIGHDVDAFIHRQQAGDFAVGNDQRSHQLNVQSGKRKTSNID
jgi:hypothetical protein